MFYILLGIMVLYAVGTCLGAVYLGNLGLTGISGLTLYYLGLENSLLMVIVGTVFAGKFICSDFQNRTIQEAVSRGWNRAEVLISTTLVYFAGLAALMLPYPIIIGVLMVVRPEFGIPFTPEIILGMIGALLIAILITAAMMSLCVLFSFVFRKSSTTIILGLVILLIGIPVILSFGLGQAVPALTELLSWTPFSPGILISDTAAGAGAYLKAIVSGILCIAVVLAATWGIFRRAELK